jgi:hypothetical protein
MRLKKPCSETSQTEVNNKDKVQICRVKQKYLGHVHIPAIFRINLEHFKTSLYQNATLRDAMHHHTCPPICQFEFVLVLDID